MSLAHDHDNSDKNSIIQHLVAYAMRGGSYRPRMHTQLQTCKRRTPDISANPYIGKIFVSRSHKHKPITSCAARSAP